MFKQNLDSTEQEALTFLPSLEASCLAMADAAFASAFFVSKNLAALFELEGKSASTL